MPFLLEKKMRSTLVLVLAVALTACGGGGGGGAPPATATDNTSTTISGSKLALTKVMDVTQTITVVTMAVDDLNGDGLEDVVVGGWGDTNDAYITIFIQNQDGTLTNKTSTLISNNVYNGSQKILIADFDNDGKKDIFFPGFNDFARCVNANPCGSQSVMLWNNSSSFIRQDFTDKNISHGSCMHDFDGDGYIDILVGGGTNGSVGGLYLNNKNRTFTLNSSLLSNNYFSTCGVIKSDNGDIAVLLGNNNQVPGYSSNITVFDKNLNWKFDVGVGGVNTATDLINNTVTDVNSDGQLDFVLIYNNIINGQPGAKEVWLNRGNSSWTYSSTIDNLYHNMYYTVTEIVGNLKLYYFAGGGNDGRIYSLNNGSFVSYNQDKFTTMTADVGSSTSVQTGAIYQNRSTGKIFMLQLIHLLTSGGSYTSGFYVKEF